MRLFLFVLLALTLNAAIVWADSQQCSLITTTASTSIASGAVTTAEINMVPGGSLPSSTTPNPTYLKLGVDLTDASDGVSNLQFTFTAAETTGGTFRKNPLCADSAPTLTCGAVDLNWDPQTHGKNFWLKPIDWGFPYGKITVTPTGHGAGDAVVLTVYGCRE